MRIFSNTAVSVDGKISSRDNDYIRLGSAKDLARMDEIRAEADAVLVGGNTFRHWSLPLFSRSRHSAQNPAINAIVSRTLNLVFSPEYLAEKCIHPVVFTANPKRNPKRNPNFPVEVVDYETEVSPQMIVKNLEQRGVKNLLLEGGGDLLFQFLKAGFLHEMYVTLCPKIVGGRIAPTLMDGDGFLSAHIHNLKLLSSRIEEDEIYLHYKVLQ